MSQQQDQPDTQLLAEQATAQAKEAIKQVNTLRTTVNDLKERLNLEQQERQRLESELQSLRDDTELISEMRNNSELTKKDQRAIILVQTLYRDAGPNGKARLTIKEGRKTLQSTVSRSQLYPTFNRATELVDDTNVLRFVEKPRGSNPPSHLLMDRSAGEVPQQYQPSNLEVGV